MKKISIILLLIFLLSSCTTGGDDSQTKPSDSPSTSGALVNNTESDSEVLSFESKIERDHMVKYTNANHADGELESAALTFYSNGYCTLFINYFHGVCDVIGTYKIDGDIITVDVELRGSFFEGNDENDNPYMEDKCTFHIVSNNEIVLESEFYNWEMGGSLVSVN